MDKGKIKKEKEYLSLLLVPHSSDKIKTFKVSAFYLKLGVTIVTVLATLCYLVFVIVTTVSENQRLKSSITSLHEISMEHESLLREKIDEIAILKQREDSINSKIKEFTDKYKEMTESYISERVESSLSSRSSTRSDRSFVEDATELKELLDNLDRANATGVKINSDLSETQEKLEDYLSYVPTFWPTTGRISSVFGYRKDPFTAKKTYHSGVDIAAPKGQNILAAASGKVIFSGTQSGYGLCVFIDHGRGMVSVYGHCSKLKVKTGDIIEKGDLIAKVGSTGRSTGPHLHFELRVNNEPVDPLKYLEKK